MSDPDILLPLINMKKLKHPELLISILILIPIGISTKFYHGIGAEWVRGSSGAILYEIFWCLLIFGITRFRPRNIALSVFIITCILEFLQLWHPPFLEWIRSFFIGRLLIGSTFSWYDFPYYLIGSGIGWLWMRRYTNRNKSR